jgi:hypothetical protein
VTDAPASKRRRRKREIPPDIDRRAEAPFNAETVDRMVIDPYPPLVVCASFQDQFGAKPTTLRPADSMGRLDVRLRRSTSGWTGPRAIEAAHNPQLASAAPDQLASESTPATRVSPVAIRRRPSFRSRRTLRQRGESAVCAREDNEAAKSLADEIIGMPDFIAGDSLTTLQRPMSPPPQ